MNNKKQKNIETKKSSILEKIMNNKLHGTAKLIEDTSYFTEGITFYKTAIPVLNLIFSGLFSGGLHGGMTVFAGPSRHFKTNFGLVTMKAFLDADPENYVMFYDSERGLSKTQLEEHGIDMSRVVYDEITYVEDVAQKMTSLLNDLEKKAKIMFFVDSVGNLPSLSELEKAVDGKITADMQRAKTIKSFCRLVSGSLKFKEIPCVVIAHTYNTLEMFSKPVVSGGTGLQYSPDNVILISRSQEKDENDVFAGWRFNLLAEKSRFIQERSKFSVTVTYEDGIHRFSGLIGLLVEFGMVEEIRISRRKGYSLKLKNGKELQTTDEMVDRDEKFWETVFKETDFQKMVEMKYALGKQDGVLSEETVEETT